MIDDEDRELLLVWGVRYGVWAVAAATSIVVASATAGIAWRIFDLLRG